MKKVFIALALMAGMGMTAKAQYQVKNSDFEKTADSNGETQHWHGFKTASGSLASMAKGTLAVNSDTRPGSAGKQSIVITSGSVLGVVNNGTVTNGKLNAGNISPSNTANHSEMKKDDGNYYSALSGHPDALKVWLKFSQARANKDYPFATISAIIWDPAKANYYQDPEDKTYTNVLAKAQNKEIPTGDWTEYVVPFDYESFVSNSASAGAILVTFSTNATPGKGISGDKVFIDDLELVYYSELATATYKGNAISPVADGTITIEDCYDADELVLTSNGRGASIERSYDEGSAQLTIRVEGEDISVNPTNYHTYTIQFAKRGDVNGDGEVTIADVTALVNIILGKAASKAVADVNGDGDVTIADVTALVNIILGK